MSNRLVVFIAVPVLALAGLGTWLLMRDSNSTIDSFTACVDAGNPVAESFPRQCTADGKTFVEDIDQTTTDYTEYTTDKGETVRLVAPLAGDEVSSPLSITGAVRGSWSFEASFPIVIHDSAGNEVATGHGELQGDWMTEDFVPFEASLDFIIDKNVYSNKGTIILHKDNPSGLPENDDILEIPVEFAEITISPTMCTADARLCPDGSAVGRIGPNCEFAQCPNTNTGGDRSEL